MKVMVMVMANSDTEASKPPTKEAMAEMGEFNQQLAKAGVLLVSEGLKATRFGKRVRISGTSRTVIDGPFAESKELVAGFQVWQVRSMDEALEWARRIPNMMSGEAQLEIRPVVEMEEFGDAVTPEHRERKENLRRAHYPQT